MILRLLLHFAIRQPVRWSSDHHNSDMFLHVFLLSAVTAPASAATRKLQTNLTCFRSSDPAAVIATQLHGNHDDQRFLWTKDPDSALLPQCSSSSFSPPASRCEVCHLGQVFIICADLPDGAVLYLERPGVPYRTERSACPLPPAAVEPPADENTRNHFAAVASLILLILILTAVAHGSQQDGSGETAEPPHDLEMDSCPPSQLSVLGRRTDS
ncbi:uncharacterized protein LOC106954337 isoform X2 [Poecilia latipinna]|uniref:uncharacterized protein LOC106954337 isoform X2 n=1 Tax=Poecilia latipinna TaxID=48699 RepID=UPI00072E3ED3|nr:PREDICTED: uncharacterized protein LOC106954337 isoform X2 [Poecilia latipinna]